MHSMHGYIKKGDGKINKVSPSTEEQHSCWAEHSKLLPLYQHDEEGHLILRLNRTARQN